MYKFGFDLDGCVVDFTYGYFSKINELFGIEGKLSKIKEFDSIRKMVPHLSDKEYWELVDSVIFDWEKMPIYNGAKEFLIKYYKNEKIPVSFITARNENKTKFADDVEKCTIDWLNHNVPEINFKINFGNNKVDYCLENDINIMVEDNTNNAVELAKHNICVLLMRRPWNFKWLKEHKSLPSRFIVPVNDWEMISLIYDNLIMEK